MEHIFPNLAPFLTPVNITLFILFFVFSITICSIFFAIKMLSNVNLVAIEPTTLKVMDIYNYGLLIVMVLFVLVLIAEALFALIL